MADTTKNVKERHIPVSYDDDGNPFWHSMLSPPDGSVGVCMMVPDRVIPVIIVPGVMGSNLKNKNNKQILWRLDNDKSMLPWANRGAIARKKYLTPQGMEVDPDGKLFADTPYSDTHLRERGWGEVGYHSYGEFLAWFEHSLNDFDQARSGLRHRLIGESLRADKGEEALTRDEGALSYRYRFPVWACGYNWLDDNAASAARLQSRITQAINHYTAKGQKCEKVILVTHSMGGLVARCCSEVKGERARIFGIVHGVLPAIGAAAVYRRAKAGTRNTATFQEGVESWAEGWATAAVLGNNAAAMTAVLSTAPGPMQLLPTPQYGDGWLRFWIDDQDIRLPRHRDPYTEIYTVRDRWWSLCDDQLMDPLNDTANVEARGKVTDAEWNKYVHMIKMDVKGFHQSIANKYHPTTYVFYGDSRDHPAYGNVTWHGRTTWGEHWLSGDRPADPLDGRAIDPDELGTGRTVATPLEGNGWMNGIQQRYTISNPDEPGDATVPARSGAAPQPYAQSVLRVSTDHEGAFRDCEAGRVFTLRAVVKIAQAVQATALAYD